MDILFLIGRILLGVFFVMSGINHLFGGNREMMRGYAKSKGVPFPALAVFVTGLLLFLGGLGVLLGAYIKWSIVMLIVFLVPVSFVMHDFWNMKKEEKMSNRVNFMKNMALAGALLMLLQLSSYSWSYVFWF